MGVELTLLTEILLIPFSPERIPTNQIVIPSPPMAYSLLLNNNFHEITRHKTSLIAKVIATVSEKVWWSKSVLVKVPLPGKKKIPTGKICAPSSLGGGGNSPS